MKVLALDQSLNTTGWAVFDGDSLIDFNHFKISAAGAISDRLGSLWEQIHKVYKTYEFDYLYLEDIQYQNNKDTYKKLAYAQAVILLWCFFNEIKYLILRATIRPIMLHEIIITLNLVGRELNKKHNVIIL